VASKQEILYNHRHKSCAIATVTTRCALAYKNRLEKLARV